MKKTCDISGVELDEPLTTTFVSAALPEAMDMGTFEPTVIAQCNEKNEVVVVMIMTDVTHLYKGAKKINAFEREVNEKIASVKAEQ